MNAKRIARTSLTAVAFFLLISVNSAFAGSGSKHARGMEINAATARLDNYSLELEKSIRYAAPVLFEDAASLEANEAGLRLDEIAANLEAGIAYVAPAVEDDVAVQDAIENLEDLDIRLTWSLAYVAPSVVE
jgi:hypothetical protein